MQHEIYFRGESIPSGFETYCVLLIPSDEWFGNAGMQNAFRLFAHFKRFGEMIGPSHLACWFCRYFGGYAKGVDIDLVAALPVDVFGNEAVTEFLRKRDVIVTPEGPSPRYDIERARLICSDLGLPYGLGPYVAFFTSPPELPYYMSGPGECG
jgi:hypothetical protein